MENLNDRKWEWFNYKDIFKIESGKGGNIYNLDTGGEYPYISATSTNNGLGLDEFVHAKDSELHNENTITISRTGSVGEAFYHSCKYVASKDRIRVLIPKYKMNVFIGIFLITIIRLEKYRFNYGRTWGTNRIKKSKIKLPVDNNKNPDWRFMEDYIKSLPYNEDLSEVSCIERKPKTNLSIKLYDRQWEWFLYEDIFEVESGKGGNIYNLDTRGEYPYISATSANNGLGSNEFVHAEDSELHNENTITISRTGSVGEAFYHSCKYVASNDSVRVLIPKFKMNVFIGMFLITIIRLEKYRFNYGRTWGTNRMKKSKIKLPVNDNGKPDWRFMEDYVKSLPYSSNL